jgi:hypothetical protein
MTPRRVVSFTSLPLYLRIKSPGTPCVRVWVGPRASLGAGRSRRELNPGSTARIYTDRVIPVPTVAAAVVSFYLGLRVATFKYNSLRSSD